MSVPSANPPLGAPGELGSREPALSLRGLTKRFGDRTVLSGLDLDVAPGEVVALLGANGSGKSTALRCVVGLASPDEGTVRLHGESLSDLHGSELVKARSRAAMVFQHMHLVRRRTALDNVCAGGLARVPTLRSLAPFAFPTSLRVEARECLERVGLADRAHERVSRLSGGQQQRVAIARALCQRADVLLADEPVSALDPAAARQVMALLTELACDGLAVCAVLHQPDLARSYSNRVVGLLDGRMAWSVAADQLDNEAVDALYASESPVPADESPEAVARSMTLGTS